MKEILQQLFSKLISYFLFIFIVSFVFICALTGEFPPKIQSVRDQYQSFIDMKKNYSLVMKNASERLKNADSEKESQTTAAVLQLQKMTTTDQDLSQNVKELRVDQARIQTQLETIIQQNREILTRLSGQAVRR